MKKGFTLAEVLITLVIIGVIASMTIPTLMNSTNQQEFRVGLKKAISALNQAMSLNYALEGRVIGDQGLTTADGLVSNLFSRRLSILSTGTTNVAFADNTYVTSPSAGQLFYTADGMRYAIGGFNSAGSFDDEANEYYYGYILIDVNGDKGPNTITTTATTPKDTYIATLYGNRVVAGTPVADATNGGDAAKGIMFDQKSWQNNAD